jgi:DNA-binding MarR family transcriptional regulator
MSSGDDPKPPYVGYSMRVVWQWVWQLNNEAAVRAGYDDVNPAHLALFGYPGLDGRRPTDIAQTLHITKQSVHELLGHLERRGYLTREPDPTNLRARLVRLTAKGRTLQEVIRRQALDGERQVAAILGDRRFKQFKDALAILVGTLQPEGG